MNKGLLALNGILGVAVIILFYLHFSGKEQKSVKPSDGTTDDVSTVVTTPDSLNQYLALDSNITAKPIKIAYVDSDSLDKNLKMLKDVEQEIMNKEKQLKGQMQSKQQELENRLKTKYGTYEKKRNEFSLKAPTLTDAQLKTAQQELMEMEQQLAGMDQSLQREMMSYQAQLEKDFMILKAKKMEDYYVKVQGFCKSIANQLGFDYILLYSRGGVMLHANNVFDISKYVVEAINKEYDAKNVAK